MNETASPTYAYVFTLGCVTPLADGRFATVAVAQIVDLSVADVTQIDEQMDDQFMRFLDRYKKATPSIRNDFELFAAHAETAYFVLVRTTDSRWLCQLVNLREDVAKRGAKGRNSAVMIPRSMSYPIVVGIAEKRPDYKLLKSQVVGGL